MISALCAMAQGTVRGKVLDRQTDEALKFVNVRVTQGEKLVKGTVTDVNGSFQMAGLADGNYQLQVSYMGYKDFRRTFTISDKDRRVHFNALYIAEDSKTLKEHRELLLRTGAQPDEARPAVQEGLLPALPLALPELPADGVGADTAQLQPPPAPSVGRAAQLLQEHQRCLDGKLRI